MLPSEIIGCFASLSCHCCMVGVSLMQCEYMRLLHVIDSHDYQQVSEIIIMSDIHEDKTEVQLITHKVAHKMLNTPHVTHGHREIVPAKDIRNILCNL